jgi:hypothetical protein
MIPRRVLMRFSLLILMLVSSQVGAQSLSPQRQITPDVLQGIWSQPDCTVSDSALILSRFFALYIEENSNPETEAPTEVIRFSPIRAWRSEKDDEGANMLYYYRLSNRESYILKIVSDGTMRMGYALVHPKQPLYTAWGISQEKDSGEFHHCKKLSDTRFSFTQEEVNIPFLMDQAMDACLMSRPEDFSHASACHTALFEIADNNKDNAVDAEELVRIYKQVGFVALSLNACGLAPRYPGPVPAEALEFSAQALEKLDQDRSKTLDKQEIVSGLSNPLLIQRRLYQFVERARSIRGLLPFLPLADAEKVCTSDPIVEEPEWTGQAFPVPKAAPSPLNNFGSCGSCAAVQNKPAPAQ